MLSLPTAWTLPAPWKVRPCPLPQAPPSQVPCPITKGPTQGVSPYLFVLSPRLQPLTRASASCCWKVPETPPLAE